MLKPVKMEQLNILVHEGDVERVTKEILRIGVFHLLDIQEIAPWTDDLSVVKVDESLVQYEEQLQRLRSLSKKLAFDIEKEPEKLKDEDFKDIDFSLIARELETMDKDISRSVKEKEEVEGEKAKLLRIYEQVKMFAPMGMIDTSSRFSFLEMVVGKIDEKNIEIIRGYLRSIPSVVLPFKREHGQVTLLLLVMKRDRVMLEKAMKEASFQKMDMPEGADLSHDVQMDLARKIDAVDESIEGINAKLRSFKRQNEKKLRTFLRFMQVSQLMLKAMSQFKKTGKTFIVSGWVPKRERSRVTERISTITDGKCYVEAIEPESIPSVREGDVQVPVKFQNPEFLKPFEMLITSYGIPAYNTIDPTIFVAFTFLIMFGIMFGDVGHGLALVAIGLITCLKKNIRTTTLRIGHLILYCGISSMIFGFLYGSIFGLEHVLPTLWMKPMHNIMYLFGVVISFGVGILSLGIIINIINAINRRSFIKGIFHKTGLIGGLMYWGCVGIVCKIFIEDRAHVSMWIALPFIVFPIVVLFLRAPIERLLGHSRKLFPHGFLTYIMETLIEIVEIFTGYLANTVSFIRVGAFALSHAGLFLAIFTLAGVFQQGIGGFLMSSLVMVLGNIIIIALEGLIVAIQGIRLQYYEFFGKFFHEEGKEYKPISL